MEELEGLAKLVSNLQELGSPSLRMKAMNAMVKAGGRIVRDRASLLAPRGATGHLQDKMTMRLNRASDLDEAEADVGPDKVAWYGFFHEFGTRFLTPSPFLQPALQQVSPEATIAMVDAFWKTIPAHMKGVGSAASGFKRFLIK